VLPLGVTIPRPMVAASTAQLSIINDSSIPICYYVEVFGHVRGHLNSIGHKFCSVQPFRSSFVGARQVAQIQVILNCVFMAPDVSFLKVRWVYAPAANIIAEDAVRWWNKSHLKSKCVEVKVTYENNAVPPLRNTPFQQPRVQENQPAAWWESQTSPSEVAKSWARFTEGGEEEEEEDSVVHMEYVENPGEEEDETNDLFMSWTVYDVCKWMIRIGLEHFRGNFKDNCIDGKTLASISDDFVMALGIESEVERNIFMKELEALKGNKAAYEEMQEEEVIKTTTERTKVTPGDGDIPSEFYDAISFELMHDPVFTCDGHTYERQSISLWLESHNTSPITGLPLENKKLVPNFALKSLLQRYL